MYDRMDALELFDADDLFDEEEWYDEYDGEDIEIIDEDDDDGIEELEDAMAEVFGSLSPAESFSIGKALGTVGAGATQLLGDPTVRQIAATAAPIAGGALGTVVGGPVGTAAGAALGQAAGKALAPKPVPAPSPTVAPMPPVTAAPAAAPIPVSGTPAPPKPPAAQGSAAATKALVMSQQPDVLKCLLSLALGEKGRRDVNGIPVGAVMNMLATMYAKAAEDADELLYASEGMPAYLLDDEGNPYVDPAASSERADALYAAMIGAENEYLAEAGLA